MNRKNRPRFLRTLFFSVAGASLAGIMMSLGNILIESLRGNSIFTFEDIYSMASWHLSVGAVVGFIGGLFTGLFRLLRTNLKDPSWVRYFFVYTYFAIWLLVQGYINIYLFAGLSHAPSIIINAVMLILGTGLFILIVRRRKKERVIRPFIWKAAGLGLLGLLLISSFISKQHFSRSALNHPSAKQIRSSPSDLNAAVVLWDAVRFDHVGCYGYFRNTTPNLDALAEQGVLFENAIAHSSRTKESVPSLFTSLLPSSHNVKHITDALPKNLLILPQAFKAAGYRTAAISFNPYISPPYGYKKGFNHFLTHSEEFIKINKTVLGHLLELSRRLPLVGEWTFSLLKFTRTNLLSESSLASTDAATITDKAIQWLEKNPRQAFFLFLHYEGGHAPYEAPEEYARLFGNEYDEDRITQHPESAGIFLPFQEGEPVPADDREKMVAQYDAKIRYHDDELGRLVGYLRESGLLEKTLLVIVSDHGEDFYDHHGWGHGHSLYEELIHVPLVLYAPEYLPQGRRVEDLCGLTDLFPMVLNLCGMGQSLDLPYTLDGRDITPLVKATSGPEHGRRYVLSELTQGQNFARALRGERYKLIAVESGGEERIMLFDLEQDPDEQKDISQEQPELSARLFKLMQERIEQAENRSFKPQRTSLDAQEKKALRSLGYIK